MKAVKLKMDAETGELIPNEIMITAEKSPSIFIDISDVEKYHKEPEKLLEKIRIQAGYPVFDISEKAGRDACRAHAANIIKTISPAIAASKAMAAEAKKVINQDLAFRRDFESGVREIAAFHRAPLTDYEEEQARKVEEKRLAAQKIEEERLYLLDWDDAIAFNELHDLKKEKERELEKIAAKKKAEEDQIAFEKEVLLRVEQEKIKIAEQVWLSEQKENIAIAKHAISAEQNSHCPVFLTRTILIDAVAAHLGISMKDAEKALFEVFLI